MKKIIIAVLFVFIAFMVYSISNDTFLTKYISYIKNDKESILRFEAEDMLKKKLNDPGSYQFISFSNDAVSGIFEETDSGTKYYILSFRSKNDFGALIINNVRVSVLNGSVTKIE